MENLNLARTTLIVIDLQKGIMESGDLQPYTASEVIEKNNQLAQAMKNTAGWITLVNVDPTTMRFLNRNVSGRGYGNLPAEFLEYVMPIVQDGEAENVIKITKHNPGAFFGAVHTGVDQQHAGRTPLEDLQELKQYAKKVQIAVAGGINSETVGEYVALEPDIVIVGSGILNAADPVEAAKTIKAALK